MVAAALLCQGIHPAGWWSGALWVWFTPAL